MLVLVDLDGTICDWAKRAKKAGVQPDRDNKEAFQEWLDRVQNEKSLAKDEPILEVVKAVNALYTDGYRIVFLTGRSENYRRVTTNWLLRHLSIASPVLYMRGDSDGRSPAKYKESVIKTLLKEHRGHVLAIDDDFDSDTNAVYKKLGIVHLKVMA